MVRAIATKAEFDEVLAESPTRLVVVDFTATWCGPCRMLAPKFEAWAEELSDKDVLFVKVDVDSNSETAASANVAAMPTIQLFKNKEMVKEIVGLQVDLIESSIKELL